MTTPIFKRSFTLDVNDTYTLNTMVPDADRPVTARLAFTRVAAYDGVITLSARPRGSAGAWKPIAYIDSSTGAVSAATIGAADKQLQLDATGLELALVSTGRTVGSMTVDVTDSPEP